MRVEVVENVLKLNDEIAALNRKDLREAAVFTVDLMGSPGCGKTALLEATIQRLTPVLRVGVIVGDLATTRDAQRMARWSPQVIQVNTGKTCHLEANHVRQALGKLQPRDMDILFIENVGNLICPVGFDLGQDLKVGMFSVSEGDDKAAKHPYIVQESALLLLNKIDLAGVVPFDLDLFRQDVKRVKPSAMLIELSALTGAGFDAWMDWLNQQRAQVVGGRSAR